MTRSEPGTRPAPLRLRAGNRSVGVRAAQLVLCALLGVFCFALAATATDVTLAWDANPPEENVTGYVVFWGTVERSADVFVGYEHELDVGAVTTVTVEIGSEYVVYYFAAIAYNGRGLRSGYSDELVRPPDPPSKPQNVRRQ